MSEAARTTVAEMFGLPADWIVSMAPQGSDEWLAARRGVITGSRAKDARDSSTGLTAQQTIYVNALKLGKHQDEAMALAGYKKAPSSEAVALALAGQLERTWGATATLYARDVARERVGATVAPIYENAAMRFGSEQEAHARRAYECRTGFMVDAAGFIATPDRKFGVSVDGLVFDVPGQRGGIEVKTIVSSNVLFEAVLGGDISAYIDQCDLNVWAWNLDWIDLCLWVPDLPVEDARLTVIRIERNQDRIDGLLEDLVRFDGYVQECTAKLLEKLANPFGADSPAQAAQAAPVAPPWEPAPAAAAATPLQPLAATPLQAPVAPAPGVTPSTLEEPCF